MWQQGKMPWYEKPPKTEADAVQKTVEQIMQLPVEGGPIDLNDDIEDAEDAE